MKRLMAFCLFVPLQVALAQSITLWTEENGTLGLGYPVPIPVDTPEPFDGFRSYNGLFTKHQSMALNNNSITGYIVGQTHNNRDIWAYILSDENNITMYGVKEGAMLINGNIHAREWQTPEVLTGIMELLDSQSQDRSIHQFLLENTSIVALPVNNVDGLLQTQRFPDSNWFSSQEGPRDGRMRRKNMLNVDEQLNTMDDRLFGIDLNRNNAPFWATSNNSSSNVTSLVYHGSFVHSEPETLARIAASNLVDSDQLRLYTDVHSFSQVHFSVRTDNISRNLLQSQMLSDFSRFHAAFPEGKNYVDRPNVSNSGIGSTDEYFATTFEVPSWTLEVEPGGLGGVTYGGFGNNGHDGFILPESEIRRVREQLAQTFMVVWYKQAGPPSVTQLRVLEKNSGIVVYNASWDIQLDGSRQLYENVVEQTQPAEQYTVIVSFDKPMRYRNENGQVEPLPGQNALLLNPSITSDQIGVNPDSRNWINEKMDSLQSYKYYQDDTFMVDYTVNADTVTIEDSRYNLSIATNDMVGQNLDADPSTAVTWSDGKWINYEKTLGVASITGGVDRQFSIPVAQSSDHTFIPAVQPSALYFDPTRSGEGFSYELLTNNQIWIQWFTYDDAGNQRWYSGLGKFIANSIVVNQLLQTSGGEFGAGFDTNNIQRSSFGSLEIIFSGGESLNPAVGFQEVTRTAEVLYTDLAGKKLRTHMQQLSFVKGAVNVTEVPTFVAPIHEPLGLISGSWFDPSRSGEGYIIEILEDGRALMIWYTYDLEGNHVWLLDGAGEISQNGNNISLDFNNVVITSGGRFGEEFNADDVIRESWGEVHFDVSCLGTGTVSYSSNIDDFGQGEYNISKLTSPLVIPFVCDDK